MNFDFDEKQRKEILNTVSQKIEHFYTNTKDYSTTPELNLQEIRNIIELFCSHTTSKIFWFI